MLYLKKETYWSFSLQAGDVRLATIEVNPRISIGTGKKQPTRYAVRVVWMGFFGQLIKGQSLSLSDLVGLLNRMGIDPAPVLVAAREKGWDVDDLAEKHRQPEPVSAYQITRAAIHLSSLADEEAQNETASDYDEYPDPYDRPVVEALMAAMGTLCGDPSCSTNAGHADLLGQWLAERPGYADAIKLGIAALRGELQPSDASAAHSLHAALTRLIDDLIDADEHRNPETGIWYDSVENAIRALHHYRAYDGHHGDNYWNHRLAEARQSRVRWFRVETEEVGWTYQQAVDMDAAEGLVQERGLTVLCVQDNVRCVGCGEEIAGDLFHCEECDAPICQSCQALGHNPCPTCLEAEYLTDGESTEGFPDYYPIGLKESSTARRILDELHTLVSEHADEEGALYTEDMATALNAARELFSSRVSEGDICAHIDRLTALINHDNSLSTQDLDVLEYSIKIMQRIADDPGWAVLVINPGVMHFVNDRASCNGLVEDTPSLFPQSAANYLAWIEDEIELQTDRVDELSDPRYKGAYAETAVATKAFRDELVATAQALRALGVEPTPFPGSNQ